MSYLKAKKLTELLTSKSMTIAVAESCTGGLLSSHFTEIPGISKVFQGGAVCYHNDANKQCLILCIWSHTIIIVIIAVFL